MRRVLILTASYGSGHNVAAQSLARAFARAGVDARIVDHFRQLVHPTFERVSRALYYAVLRRLPAAWGLAYALGDRMISDSPLTFGVTRLGTRRLRDLLGALAPDAVVSVHATPAVAMAALAQRGVRVPPHTTVVTDFVAHSQWIARGIDRYCVAADEVKHDFIARGIRPERIVVTGVPIREEFATPGDGAAARRALGLSPRLPVVLAMAGAQGVFGHLPEVARALTLTPLPFQGLVVAGHDATVQQAVRRISAGSTIRACGYVSDVRGLMTAADLLVTKAGGMTLAEAMATEVPLVLYGSLPGQERRNERFATRNGIALVARSPRQLSRVLEGALGDSQLLERLRLEMRRLGRPRAAQHVVDTVLERGEIRR
jgi:processive 1,2-diacylglycerol beta-glucosyltransferase